jgi:tripartite-type tricarboxylate transporter receptor subunit TctC
VRDKQVGALAIGSEQRESVLPGVPTVAETLPGYVSVTWFGVAAPPGTPADVRARIAAAVADALKQPEVARRLADLNVRAVGNTPEEAARFMTAERERWSKVISATGAKIND